MEIEKIKITDINPAEYNPRSINNEELTKLKNSINEFGLVDPIIINLKNNKIIGGHQRYEVLINEHMLNGDFYGELNLIRMGDVGWIFTETDLTIKDEDHEKALNLALNKISGEWDFDKLGVILDELSLNEFDIELTGFDNLEMEEYEYFDDDEVDRNIEEAFENIFNSVTENENEKINSGISDNRIISFYTANEDLYYEFLDFLGLEPVKLDKKRNIKIEDLECLKEPETD